MLISVENWVLIPPAHFPVEPWPSMDFSRSRTSVKPLAAR